MIAAAVNRHGICVGIHCGDGKMAKETISYGHQYVTFLTDNAFLAGAAKAAVAGDARRQSRSRQTQRAVLAI